MRTVIFAHNLHSEHFEQALYSKKEQGQFLVRSYQVRERRKSCDF